MFKVSNRNSIKKYETCSKLTRNTRSDVVVVNVEHILHLFSVFIVDFEQVNLCCVQSTKDHFPSISIGKTLYPFSFQLNLPAPRI